MFISLAPLQHEPAQPLHRTGDKTPITADRTGLVVHLKPPTGTLQPPWPGGKGHTAPCSTVKATLLKQEYTRRPQPEEGAQRSQLAVLSSDCEQDAASLYIPQMNLPGRGNPAHTALVEGGVTARFNRPSQSEPCVKPDTVTARLSHEPGGPSGSFG
ncbi:hypothetical protein AAFF_G00230140 [Aldrovandia affinis]|uniref:Uncharacterized protein n=1 Tax=Aldrovandia affinis TaxID=143900 RepID=A0AAD7SVW5_9TELE|nr:hypothetical protein AAFF_G00230140 [Aldrovandia affinis]